VEVKEEEKEEEEKEKEDLKSDDEGVPLLLAHQDEPLDCLHLPSFTFPEINLYIT